MRVLLPLVVVLLAGCAVPDDEAGIQDETEAVVYEDVADEVNVDLLDGAYDRTWSFDFAEGAKGHFTVNVESRMQGLVQPSACVKWTRTFQGGESNGNEGSCPQGGANIMAAVSGGDILDDSRQVFHMDGDDLKLGHYTVTVTAPSQANRLAVVVSIDNPPNDE